jgi:hypothetical protein
MEEHPPRPRLALAVGIVGHRLDRLPKDTAARNHIADRVEAVLEAIGRQANTLSAEYGDYFSEQRPIITVVSALAEGADRMAAKYAATRGPGSPLANQIGADFALDAPLPFAAETYVADFETEESKAEFDYLVKDARSVLALPGSYGTEDEKAKAYELAGLTILSQADILLAVYDGGAAKGVGGTADMVNRAALLGMPIIYVEVASDAGAGADRGKGARQDVAQIRWDGFDEYAIPGGNFANLQTATMAKLEDLLDLLVRPPQESEKPQHGKSERVRLRRYFKERQRRLNLSTGYTLLRAVFGNRPLSLSKVDWFPPSAAKLAAELAGFTQTLPRDQWLGADTVLTRAYGWADMLGVRFAQVFRSAFVANFVFAAFAVVAAATALVWADTGAVIKEAILKLTNQSDVADAMAKIARELADHKHPFVAAEFFLIGAVLLITITGLRRGWHRRWVEPREIAERFRAALPLWMLGMRPPNFAGEEPSWTGWYARAVIREQGMRKGSLDAAGMTAARAGIKAMLKDQCGFHASTTGRMRAMEFKLERAGLVLFSATLLSVVVFLIAHWFGVTMSLRMVFLTTAIAAGLPALATASYGIRVIGDFGGVADRSDRTKRELDRVVKAIEIFESAPPDLGVLRARAQAAAAFMLGDVESWRLSAESRALTLPG